MHDSSKHRDDRAALLARVRAEHAAMTDEEDAAITAAALADPDNPPIGENELRRIGRPPAAVRKRQVTVRLDPEVIHRLKAGGSGWQTRMNTVLRNALGIDR
ncbi:BrnA antitoxin family protein [Aurantimonas sp. E1-2-R+4]|uniref:BrnA antitoxin family protein n=1 Tax=Aurantimonas sp. E1-2-R+4 TaxID=3113714 RepID=UPI002F93F85F